VRKNSGRDRKKGQQEGGEGEDGREGETLTKPLRRGKSASFKKSWPTQGRKASALGRKRKLLGVVPFFFLGRVDITPKRGKGGKKSRKAGSQD